MLKEYSNKINVICKSIRKIVVKNDVKMMLSYDKANGNRINQLF